ncbi:MAG: general secretion pathway protein E [Kiritimatiellia bacterium]|jgi:type II secretory ATPase GspE/PulE/Tfp pilus assembly ATPase PilB-like protein
MDTPHASPLRTPGPVRTRMLDLLAERALMPLDQIEALRDRINEPLERILIDEQSVMPSLMQALLAEITGIPAARTPLHVNEPYLTAIPIRAVLDYQVIPIESEDNDVITLVADQIQTVNTEDDLRLMIGRSIRWNWCAPEVLRKSIQHYYGIGLDAFCRPGLDDSTIEAPDITGLVQSVIEEAVNSNATDIHFEPEAAGLRLRFRIDGALNEAPLPAGAEQYARAIVSSIKAMAQLNVAEHRLPQDGRFDHTIGEDTFDLRVSILPYAHGEAANLRILNRHSSFLHLDQLGFDAEQRANMNSLLSLAHGMILFTGPTGSGKTSSLYASLDQLNATALKIITLEDPIEYEIPGINQMQVHPDIGFTFSAGLRAMLRHDPDVVLIGEIRDSETASISVSAALTGHLVFSSLHTNDAVSAIPRLIDMGVEPYLVASSLEGVIAQRLIRLLCPDCKVPTGVDQHILTEMRLVAPTCPNEPALFGAVGCPECLFTGYKGRKAIYEILLMDDALRTLTVERSSSDQLKRTARKQGLKSLRESGWACALEGLTSVDEVLRVTQRPSPRELTQQSHFDFE